ncbi:hypothetical protein THAOC_13308 [Thalassiosira oceanica]|uniref:Pop1 N-terminal domain-containing protein n=1 Tax=Thalassiosira oceanica TaxID=159749 RepID=K0SXQ5_THAOC|nr:hypothetical protein THAOC_13308 [Thalassiosira oceanica]|eukprot:EJK65796.1 hypothetical protein THAOC_13308 [Thalassiosira oceanica]
MSTPSSSRKRKDRPTTPHRRDKPHVGDQQPPSRQRRRQSDFDTHQFLDASASVHAGLFGARRLPEIKALWRSIVSDQLESSHDAAGDGGGSTKTRRIGASGGGKISSRHLRRRTNSHKRRRQRFTGGGAEDEGIPAPKSKSIEEGQDSGLNRRARRKPTFLKELHSRWWDASCADDEQACNWLPTHLWHAKRFHMAELFSWSVPLVHTNRGSRASLRLAASVTDPKCTVQDATWEVNGRALRLAGESVQSLVTALQRLCGSDAEFFLDGPFLGGKRAVDCELYEVDSCPLRPIGPAVLSFDSSDDVGKSAVSILVHPMIQKQTEVELAKLDRAILHAPLSLIRLRGRTATSTVKRLIGHDENLDGCSHGSLFDLEIMGKAATARCHRPNRLHSSNIPSAGWDIVCHPSSSLDLFKDVVNNCGACAIGMVEHDKAQLEAYPPLPMFPRDYPDTQAGRAYWSGGQHPGTKYSKDCLFVRSCLEMSWGKTSTALRKAKRLCLSGSNRTGAISIIDWDKLIPRTKNDYAGSTAPLVVRGSFGAPFVQLANGCGRFQSSALDQTTTRRPRRRKRSPNSFVKASSLSTAEYSSQSNLCRQLKSSLSLPAILRCELICEGKGRFEVGDSIFTVSRDPGEANGEAVNQPLGFVSSCGFSPSRGKPHGVGFIGASRFIDALDRTEHAVGVTIPQSNERKMALRVVVKSGNGASCGVILSLLS